MGTINKGLQRILVPLADFGLHSGRHICKESAHTQTTTLFSLDCSVEPNVRETHAFRG